MPEPTPDPAHASAGELPILKLRKREERRVRGGHLWVYSNEVDTKATPLKAFSPGDPVTLHASNGRFLGHGYVNPRSLIAVRLLSRSASRVPDEALLEERLRGAIALREQWLGSSEWGRLVHGEGDLLPGLVLDRYGDLLVGQITTAGMARWQEALERLLPTLLPQVNALRWANDTAVRELEGLARDTTVGFGTPCDTLHVEEGEARFALPAASGQKTGWYYDQRANRERLLPWLRPGARVLDVFSYVGAWGIRAAMAGAGPVTCVDASRPALDALKANAQANGVSIGTRQGDAAQVLKDLANEGQRYEVIIVDPPALIPRRKDVEAGTRAYWQLNELAMRLLADDGLLVSCSCSHHLTEEALTGIVAGCAKHQHRAAQIIARGEQAPDHPVHPAIVETRYLKALFCRVSGR
ncbi:MAG: class I SAM-dependent rRNA methyltransferase [Pseudomonadota bacterium]